MIRELKIEDCKLQIVVVLAFLVCVLFSSNAAAEQPKTREIFVPFSDLHVLLENQPKRVLIGRKEYEELLKKAEKTPEVGTPLATVLTAADYSIVADRQRAEIVGELTLDVLSPGLHAVPLDVGGVGLRGASLDGRPASLGLGPDGRPRLFVEGVGQHRLKLEMTSPLQTTSARQVLTYRLPRPAAATLRLDVPGDVEIKGGADVVSRKVESGRTRFELLARPGDTTLLMTLNSHLHRSERAVVARSVLLDEISESHETLRAAVTLSILHRAVDRFRFVVPDGFEITDVSSPLLARWEVVEQDGRRVLDARLREQTTETVELDITAIRAPAVLDNWSAPRLEPLDVVGSVDVFGLLLDDRLKAESFVAEGLIPVDTSTIGPVARPFRAVAVWYAPQGKYALSARFIRPTAEMDATSSLLLAVSDKGLALVGGVSLVPHVEKRFWFDFTVPEGWQVTRVAMPDGRSLSYEVYENASSPHPNPLPKGEGTSVAGRVRVTVPNGMPVDRVFQVVFRAVRTPKDWLGDWRRTTVEFPDFKILDVARSEGAAAVAVRDDMTVRPEKLERLVPLGADDKKRFGLDDSAVLAYRREGGDWAATLTVERTDPRLTARTLSFLRIDNDALHCHYEIAYTIEQSRVRQLVFSLPKDTPETISIKGLDGVKIKEFSHKDTDKRRQWTVALVDPHRDRVRLAVDFQQRLSASEPKDYRLPIIEAGEVVYQSGLVAVEGCAELEVDVKTEAQRVDVGELAEADYQPGRRLLGAFGYVGDPPAVTLDVGRRPGYAIPTAIVQKCQLDTFLDPDGSSRTQAEFKLQSKASFIQVVLPPGAKLWSAELNGVPLKPQRDRRGILIDLSAGKDKSDQELKIVYADDNLRSSGLRGTVRVPAPRLFLPAAVGQVYNLSPSVGQVGNLSKKNKPSGQVNNLSYEIPLVDLGWRLHLPSGYKVVDSAGTLSSDNIKRPEPAAYQLAEWLYKYSGGIFDPEARRRINPLPGVFYHRDDVKYAKCASPAPEMALCDNSRRSTTSGPSELVFVARITGMKDCRWSDPDTQSYMGASTALGREYSLASGLMEITYKSGTKVILEGPAKYRVDSDAGGFLAMGKLTASVRGQRAEDRGQRSENKAQTDEGLPLFSVRTPNAIVSADPVAEFSLYVSKEGRTLAHAYTPSVFFGSIHSAQMELPPGQFEEVRPNDPHPSWVNFYVPPRFARSMSDKPGPHAPSGIVAGGEGEGRKSGKEKYSSVDLAGRSDAEKRIEKVLDSKTQIEFIDTPLETVIEYLIDLHKIPIQIDARALSDMGIETNTPVTKRLVGIPLRSALELMLRDIGLTYMIENDVLLITTPEEAESRLTTVIYPVADLVTFRDESGGIWTDFDSFIELITSTVTPSTWDEVGGIGTIAPFETNLTVVVSQTQEVHRKLAKVLERLRAVNRTELPDGKPPLRQKPNYEGGPMGGMGGAGGLGGGAGGMGGMAGFGGAAPPPTTQPPSPENPMADSTRPQRPAEKTPAATPEPAAVLPEESEKKNDKKDTVGMSAPGTFNADLDIPFDVEQQRKELEQVIQKEKEATLAARAEMLSGQQLREKLEQLQKTISQKQDGFVIALDNAERSAVPFDDSRPAKYPAIETWRDRDKSKSYREYAGMRSLKISLLGSFDDTGRTVAFRSLGADPQLIVTLSDDSRLAMLRWALALAVALVGVVMTRKSVRTKTAYILGVMIATTLFALITPIELAAICNWMFFAAALLIPYYLVAGVLRWTCRICWVICCWFIEELTGRKIVSAAVVAAVVLGAAAAQAAKPQAEEKRIINLPDDAIILPFDPEWKNGVKDADRMLVPLAKYVQLWNRAYPDKRIETNAPPAKYALADAAYKTLLADDDYLLLTGQMEIDVFTDGYVEVPLGLGGGVLTRAELDGRPARISVLARKETPQASPQQRKLDDPFADEPPPPADRPVILLHVTGKGRHRLAFDVRMKLERQGGWRMVDGVLPAAPATALDIVVPKAKTELRLGHVADCRQYETEKADRTIKTALGVDGAVALQWRPEIDAGRIDSTLTADSAAVLDVGEDGLRLAWHVALEFRRTERARFTVDLPEGYLLESVEGTNVRGWEVRDGAAEIMLLQAAKDREQFTLRLWRADRLADGKPAEIAVPSVTVPDASLQSGRLTVRRSPIVELRATERSGVTRIDLPPKLKIPSDVQSPLGVRPFEAYSFATVPFKLRLSAVEVKPRLSADVQTVLKLSEYASTLESRVTFDVRERPVHRLRLLLPEGFTIDADRLAAPGEFQFAITKQGDRPLLTIYLAAGQKGKVPVVVSGRLAKQADASRNEIPLPRIDVLDAGRQQGDIVVQSDPGYDVAAVDLTGCESVLVGRVFGWLNPNQRSLARLALHYGGDYSGRLRLTPREPDVVCNTITNVRVTDRAVEETILLDYTVSRAGVRRLELLLPEEMADGRISTPLLQRKIISPAGDEYPGMVRARIELQEEVMGEVRVQIDNDRLLTSGKQAAPIPVMLDCRTNHRYVVLENSGRGELVVDKKLLSGVNVLSRHGKDWTFLKSYLGEDITMAYLVSSGAERPRLSFHVESRAAVETVQASIGLSETTLIVDPSGAYRAQIVLHVNNATEQYLDVELPGGASLWTAFVAGEPVKPTTAGETSANVRIPLIKTAPGDLDYEVVLRYGGRMTALGSLGRTSFPLVRCLNITPERNHVKLYLPKQYRWFDFGGTMRLESDERGFQSNEMQYEYNQLRRLNETYKSGDKWSQARASANMRPQMRKVAQSVSDYNGDGIALPEEIQESRRLYEEARRQEAAQQQVRFTTPNDAQYNRQRINNVMQAQKTQLAKNVVQEIGSNWAPQAEMKPTGKAVQGGGTQSLTKMANPRLVIQEEEEDKLGIVPESRRGRAPQNKANVNAYDRYQQQLNNQAGNGDRREEKAPVIYDPALKESRAAGGQQPEAALSAYDTDDHELYAKGHLEQPKSPHAGFESIGRLTARVEQQATGLASLDFELPLEIGGSPRGSVFCFTAPRGEQRITARYVSDEKLHRLIELAIFVMAVAALWLIVGTARCGGFNWLVRPAGAWLLIGLGVLTLIIGFLPVVGVFVILLGFWFLIRRVAMA